MSDEPFSSAALQTSLFPSVYPDLCWVISSSDCVTHQAHKHGDISGGSRVCVSGGEDDSVGVKCACVP